MNNLRGDVPEKLGLDYAALGSMNPAIVCASLSAFGRTGSRAREPGYDYLMQGYAGWMSLTGDPEGPPQKTGLSLVDLGAGSTLALGILAAVLQARATGRGTDVDVNLFHSALAQMTYLSVWHLSGGHQATRMADSAHPSQVPSQTFPTRDGWIIVMCAKEKFYRNLVTLLDRPDLAEDPRFCDFTNRLENRELLIPILKDLLARKSTDEWMALFKDQVPCAPVNTVEEAFQDPQVSEQGWIASVDHPQFGTIRQITPAIELGCPPPSLRRAPELGEHTREILMEELGWSAEAVEALREKGVV